MAAPMPGEGPTVSVLDMTGPGAEETAEKI